MKIYMTTGTFDYLKKINEKYPNEKMMVMINDDHALLLHETNGNAFFKEPRRYDVVISNGNLKKAEFIVMNHISVKDEERPLIEHHFKNKHELIINEPGYIAMRVLKPLFSNAYTILTAWKSEKTFLEWKKSASYQLLYLNNNKLFTISYTSTYFIPEII